MLLALDHGWTGYLRQINHRLSGVWPVRLREMRRLRCFRDLPRL
jgi:hypothetical protein